MRLQRIEVHHVCLHPGVVAPATKSTSLVTQRLHRREDHRRLPVRTGQHVTQEALTQPGSLASAVESFAQHCTAVRPCLSPPGNSGMTNSSISACTKAATTSKNASLPPLDAAKLTKKRRAFSGGVPAKQSSLFLCATSVATGLDLTSIPLVVLYQAICS